MDRPNIVLVTIDSLRADEVGFINNNIDTTPFLDSFANKANLSIEATAPSTHTRVSVPAILSSRYPHNFFDDFFDESEISHIATHLRTAGYETAAFHSNPLLSDFFGYNDGFDMFYDSLDRATLTSELATRIHSKIKRLLKRHPYEPANHLTDRVLDWVDSASEPYFLWIHYMDPHGPYTLNRQRGYLDKFRSEQLWQKAVRRPSEVTNEECQLLQNGYRGEISHTDDQLKRLFDALNKNTVSIITSDHGEEFGEHGSFSHGKKLFDELIQVPLIFNAPSAEPLSPDQVSLLDIVPTLLDYASVDAKAKFVGSSLFGEHRRDHVIVETNTENAASIAVRTSKHKLIRVGNEEEFYNLEADPGEQQDLSGSESKAKSDLRSVLDKFVEEQEIEYESIDGYGDIDSETEDRLQELGYLD